MAALVYRLLCFGLVLAAVAAYTFKNCIEEKNSNRRSFKCNQRREPNISVIMDDLPQHIVNLSILGNPIRYIPDKAFARFKDLHLLRLDNNRLMAIEGSAFGELHQLRSLNLSFNNISELRPSLFASLHNLTFLSLRANRLKRLPGGIFSAMPNLSTLMLQQNLLANFTEMVDSVSNLSDLLQLNLCLNKFTSLHHNRIPFPRSLSKLYLCRNNLSALGCERSFLSDVKILDLSYNSRLAAEAFLGVDLARTNYLNLHSTAVNVMTLLDISNIHAGHVDFTGTGVKNNSMLLALCNLLTRKVKSLNALRLGSNGIRELPNDTLSHCPRIMTSLDLSGNHMKSVKNKMLNCLGFLGENRYFKKLVIEHNHLSNLYSCKQVRRPFWEFEELSFRYNRILMVSDYAFNHTPNVVTLNLNINIIAFLGHKALKGLHRLKTLRLDNNLLTDLYSDTFEDLSALQTLNLRNNRISVIFNWTFLRLRDLTTLDLGGNKIVRIHSAGFRGLGRLSKLYLDGNKLKQIDMSLHAVFWHTLTVLDLEENFIRFSTLNASSPFVNLSRLSDLKLGGQRPYGLTHLPHKLFRGLRNLRSLYLTNNQISYFAADAFDDLTYLRFLTLDKCCDVNIRLPPGVFKNLRNLTKLTVENAGIQNFSGKVFGNLTRLQTLQLTHNGMQSLDVDVLNSLPSLRYLDMRHLPLSCTCLNSRLQNWTVHNDRVQVVYVYNLPCQEGDKSNFYNFETNVCYIDLGKYLFFSTSAAVALLAAFPLLYVKLYWKIKYGYYAFRSWFGEQWRKFREEEENCAYDAFVSYNSNDEDWVMLQLLPNLEGKGSSLKLCLHHRDFEPGRDIVDNIVAAVYSSRKTICVVSRNFLQSEWCSLEIQLASYRLFDEHRDVLLLVFLEPVSERQISSYHRMRKVMLKKTYLQWPASDCVDPEQARELFWSQLRRAVKAGSKLETEENDETRAAPDIDDLGDSDTQTLIADGNFYMD
ncbi:toll-like receptor 21 [Hippocampus comes]|uniref:Toll-like receptor 21 n=1 Tax=Hippocampus comes TaxID=109280 RepID=A0A3Q2XWC0_HIPCM|nr:PREDICTED: toll-like receptor 13 [Hippocampus comes]